MSTSTTSPQQDAPLNREAWLHALAHKLAPIMKDKAGLTLDPHSYKLSVGFPSVRARAAKGGRIGECWHQEGHAQEIFIHPKLGSGIQVAETVLHELIHAALPAKVGHKKPFSQAARKLGLLPEGAKPTSTFADEPTRKVLEDIVTEIGPYPHEALDTSRMPKQSTRLLKVMCDICGYTARITQKWLDEAGGTVCPTCQVQMEEADAGDGPTSPLVALDTTIEYKVKPVKQDPKARTLYDPRWSLRMIRSGKEMTWYVIDYGTHVLGVELPRLTPAENREDALNILEALRDGIMTYEDIDDMLSERDEDVDDLDNDDYLDEDEDEAPDYPEDQVDDEEEVEYEQTQKLREGWVKSEETEPAAASEPTVKQDREIGSWQYRWTV